MNNKIEIITGRKGQGKSVLAYHHARLARAGVAIFDPNAQFGIGRISSDPITFAGDLDQPGNLVVYRASGDVWNDFFDFFNVIFSRRDLAIVVDEASLLGSPQRIHPELDKLLRLGRTKGLDIFLTAHRPQDLHGITFSLADTFCFFHTTHPRDLEKIESYTSSELAARVQQLAKHQFVCWTVEAEDFYVNTNPADWRERIATERTEPKKEEVKVDG
jgi:energy-coupling factor transporter ATP-binding protein EcfA2